MGLPGCDGSFPSEVRELIDALTVGNAKPIVMPGGSGRPAIVFSVETNFQKMVRRPGGLSRQQALQNAQKEVRLSVSRSAHGKAGAH